MTWSGDNSAQQNAVAQPQTNDNPLIEKLVMKLAKEQTRARRWGIFFKLVFIVYILAIMGLAAKNSNESAAGVQEEHTAMVQINGMIGEGQGMGVSADQAVIGLRKAFEAANSKAILLRINSPGGTPVNASMIYDEIIRLKKLHPEKKVAAAITDMGTSGAYYIAAAADEIYANSASVVGSIGVISPGYGFVELMDKVGVERRIFAAGDNKAMLDPFSPLKESQREHFSTILEDVHKKFEEDVMAGRGDRLKETDEIFSGLFWSGAQAKELGLIDGFASPGGVARDILGYEKIVDYTNGPEGLDRFLEMLSAPLYKMATMWHSGNPVMAMPQGY